jgi:hypothetical protein
MAADLPAEFLLLLTAHFPRSVLADLQAGQRL